MTTFFFQTNMLGQQYLRFYGPLHLLDCYAHKLILDFFVSQTNVFGTPKWGFCVFHQLLDFYATKLTYGKKHRHNRDMVLMQTLFFVSQTCIMGHKSLGFYGPLLLLDF